MINTAAISALLIFAVMSLAAAQAASDGRHVCAVCILAAMLTLILVI